MEGRIISRQFRSDDTDRWVYGFGNGVDGIYSSSGNATDSPIDSSCSGTSGTTSLSATNSSFATGQIILIHQTVGTGAGGWELNKIASYTAGTITLFHPLTMTYIDSGVSQAQVLVLKQYSTFTQNSGHTLTAKAWNGNTGGIIAFFCNDLTTITGNISGSGKGLVGATAVNTFDGMGKRGFNNNGTGDTVSNSPDANGGAGGNGGGSSISSSGGGGGSNGSSGGNSTGGNNSQVSGGTAVGTASLVTACFGGGGGGGGSYSTNGLYGGAGGAGSGFILVISKLFSITGIIDLNGVGGTGGDQTTAKGGGGGGAGGSCLIKSVIATLGTNRITASGGAGGVGGTVFAATGGIGSVGRLHLDYCTSYSGSTTPTIDVRQDTFIQQPALLGGMI